MASLQNHPQPSIRNPQLLLIAGATATGKSQVALLLAERFGGEIISVDSMQVYRGLDIGTAKPTPAERRRVRHHLIDVVDPDQPFDAAQFARLAHAAVIEIQARGGMPILCGGTGLYFRAFLEGLGEAPPASPVLREELEKTPLPALLRELAERDSATFQKIDRQNPRRIIRALETIRQTGKPFSEQRAAWQRSPHAPPTGLFFGLARTRPDLHRRIDARVDQMFERGLVAETEQLIDRGLAKNKTAMQALGYRQVVGYLRGERPLAETIDLVKLRTRQLAKRQMTWFRRQAALNWMEAKPDGTDEDVASRIAKAFTQ
jgi:tRNA dimethylallyltransferase